MPKYVLNTSRWEYLVTNLANAPDFAHTEADRAELAGLLARAKELEAQQNVLRAEKSKIARQRREVNEQGEEIRRRLDLTVKGRFGTKSEELKRFGLMPHKLPRRKPEEEPETPARSSIAQDPN